MQEEGGYCFLVDSKSLDLTSYRKSYNGGGWGKLKGVIVEKVEGLSAWIQFGDLG